jgi:hypothetical protein
MAKNESSFPSFVRRGLRGGQGTKRWQKELLNRKYLNNINKNAK